MCRRGGRCPTSTSPSRSIRSSCSTGCRSSSPSVERRRRPLNPGAPLPSELLPDTAAVYFGGRLVVGGVDLVDLAAEVGTPLFVYDEQHLRARCREAVAAFGPGVAYAGKAFLCKAMAALVHEEGMHIDVASGGEAWVAMKAGVPADRL